MPDTLVHKWIAYAQADLDFANRALKSKAKANQWTYVLVLWHCHQAAEKMLKVVLLSQGKEIPYIHDLPRLLKKTDLKEVSDEMSMLIVELNKYYIRARYPDIPSSEPYPRSNRSLAENYFDITKKLFLWLRKYVSRKKS